MSRVHFVVRAFFFVAASGAITLRAQEYRAQDYARDMEPKLFSYDELLRLNREQELSPGLAEKLRVLTTTPFVDNKAYLSGARPRPFEIAGLGPCLRVAFWNIERGVELDYIKLFLTDKSAFMTKMTAERKQATTDGKRIRAVEMKKYRTRSKP